MTVKSWGAFLVFMAILLFGYVWETLHPGASYKILAEAGFAGLSIYLTKRTVQKHSKFGGENGKESNAGHRDSPGGTSYVPDAEELQANTKAK